MTARALGLAAVLLVLGGAGCRSMAPATQPVPGPDEGAWPQIRDAHTRTVKLYDGLALRALATATWESPEVRSARVERVAAWRRMTDAERDALRRDEEKAAAEADEFTVSIFTPDRNDNDLDAPKPSWRMALVGPAGETVATKATQLRVDGELKTLYPTIGDFDVVYRIRFPKLQPPVGGEPFTLRIAGARGAIEFPFAAGR